MAVSVFSYGIEPANLEATIWRYQPLNRLADLLKTRQLYFRRADLFEDPSEALPPEHDDPFALNLLTPEQEQERRNQRGFAACIRQSFYASCWFTSETEDVRMWRKFAYPDGVVVRSTYASLKAVGDAIPTNASIGMIRYGKAHLNPNRENLIEYASTKGWDYRHEKEARLLLWDAAPEETGNRHIDQFGEYHDHVIYPLPVSKGLRHYVDIPTLITEVLVSPFADESRLVEVSKLVQDAGFSFPVRRSDLTSKAIAIPTVDELDRYS